MKMYSAKVVFYKNGKVAFSKLERQAEIVYEPMKKFCDTPKEFLNLMAEFDALERGFEWDSSEACEFMEYEE